MNDRPAAAHGNGADAVHGDAEESWRRAPERTTATMIDRRLVHFDRDGECSEVDRDRIEAIFDPVAILGDPGMGKTTLLRGLCERTDMTCIHAADLVRAEDPAPLFSEDARPVVDGLDEIATPGTGSAVAAVLRRLRETESLRPILACRAAEWRDAADLARIEDEYAREPTVLYVPPFDEGEARAFLAEEYPGVQVHACGGGAPGGTSASRPSPRGCRSGPPQPLPRFPSLVACDNPR